MMPVIDEFALLKTSLTGCELPLYGISMPAATACVSIVVSPQSPLGYMMLL